MLSLPTELDTLCLKVFTSCDEFQAADSLRAVFTTDALQPFKDDLPLAAKNQRLFISQVKLFLLEKQLADGRELMLPFLDALRGNYFDPSEALHGDLNRLYRRMLEQHALNRHYIGYPPVAGAVQAERLHKMLLESDLPPWFDQKHIPNYEEAEAAREDALRACASLLLVLTAQADNAGEIQKALRFKKPIFPLLFEPGVELPPSLGSRAAVDFTGGFQAAFAELKRALNELNTPAGQLRELEHRLADARRELADASADQRMRIQKDIDDLLAEVESQRGKTRDPETAARAAEQRTMAAMELEREPERPAAGRGQIKFINPPPLIAPSYFQDRHNENRILVDFLRDPARRLATVVGRGGVGKTAMVCRLLKALENGELPDDLGAFRVSGIVYLSAVGTHRVSFPNLYADLLRLLPAGRAEALARLYHDPHKSPVEQFGAVLEAFTDTAKDPVVVLLDNLEDLLDPAQDTLPDMELAAALRCLLDAPPHPVKILITTRVVPKDLPALRPERQLVLPLDAGLPQPHAQRILRAGDPTGALGLKDASDDELEPARVYTSGYPRALEAITAALAADRSATLEDLLYGTPPANVVEALVGQAYTRLDPTAQKVMQGLAVFNRPVPPAAVDFLLQPYLPGLDSTPVLKRLVNMRFVSKEKNRYYMHPVDRAYALQHLTVEPSIANLQNRAADYFREIRSARADWQTLNDLSPQLAEVDLRYAAGDYDTAAAVLSEIQYDYLLMWGHYQLSIDLQEKLLEKLSEPGLKGLISGNLGSAYYLMGQIGKARACYEQAVEFAREAKNRLSEGAWLGNLGNCFTAVGQTLKGIEVFEQALAIRRETGDSYGEVLDLGNLAGCYSSLGQTQRAKEIIVDLLVRDREVGNQYSEGADLDSLASLLIDEDRYAEAIQRAQESIKIGERIKNVQVCSDAYATLALAYLLMKNLAAARTAIERSQQYDVPLTKHSVLALRGLIARRQNDQPAAREAFSSAIALAQKMLESNPDQVEARNTLALALAGCGEIEAAEDAYAAARAINSDPGQVLAMNRLLNQLEGVPKFWE